MKSDEDFDNVMYHLWTALGALDTARLGLREGNHNLEAFVIKNLDSASTRGWKCYCANVEEEEE